MTNQRLRYPIEAFSPQELRTCRVNVGPIGREARRGLERVGAGWGGGGGGAVRHGGPSGACERQASPRGVPPIELTARARRTRKWGWSVLLCTPTVCRGLGASLAMHDGEPRNLSLSSL